MTLFDMDEASQAGFLFLHVVNARCMHMVLLKLGPIFYCILKETVIRIQNYEK